jgi:hypothetical protein
MIRPGKNLGGWSLFNDLAIEHDDNLVGNKSSCRQSVRDEHKPDAGFPTVPLQQIQYRTLYRDVQSGDDLVTNQQSRIDHQRAGNRKSLPLPA